MQISGYVTVLISVHNGALTIRRALEAIAEQDYRPLEIVVVDEASSDSTPAWIRSFRAAHPEVPVHVVTRDAPGAAEALAAGLSRARGEFVAFCDMSDEWHPEKLSCQIAELQKAAKAGYALAGVTEHVEGTEIPRPAPKFRGGLLYEAVPLSGLVVRRASLEAAGGIGSAPASAIGHDIVTRLAVTAPGVSLQATMATCHRKSRASADLEALIANWDGLVATSRLSRQARQWGVGKLHAIHGWRALLADEPDRAQTIFEAALAATPYRPEAWLGLACAQMDRLLFASGLLKPQQKKSLAKG